MKHLFTIIVLAFIYQSVKAQSDSIPNNKKTDTSFNHRNSDTIHIGNVDVIVHGKRKKDSSEATMGRKQKTRPSNISTNWWVIDVGFANYIDKTNYSAA